MPGGRLAGWLADLCADDTGRVVIVVGAVALFVVAVLVNPEGRDRW